MKRLAVFAAAAMLAVGAFVFSGPASAAPADIAAGKTEAASSDLQNVYGHRHWRGHYGWGRGYYHNRWRSHHRWGSGGYYHNRWRSHHRWGSRRW